MHGTRIHLYPGCDQRPRVPADCESRLGGRLLRYPVYEYEYGFEYGGFARGTGPIGWRKVSIDTAPRTPATRTENFVFVSSHHLRRPPALGQVNAIVSYPILSYPILCAAAIPAFARIRLPTPTPPHHARSIIYPTRRRLRHGRGHGYGFRRGGVPGGGYGHACGRIRIRIRIATQTGFQTVSKYASSFSPAASRALDLALTHVYQRG